jgi:Flp pilus assembly protein TadG
MGSAILRQHLSHSAAGFALLKCRKGATAIEFGLIAPAFLLLVLGTIEFGRVFWTWNALTYSVAEASRCASIDTVHCGSASQIQAFAAARSGAGFSASVFAVKTASCGNQVSATYPMSLYIPFANYSVTLTTQSCYPI